MSNSVLSRTGGPDASPILGALQSAAQEVAAERISGALLLTDGLVDDEGALQTFPGPVHALISGHPDERDRRVRLLRAPTFGIVKEKADLVFVLEESGSITGAPAPKWKSAWIGIGWSGCRQSRAFPTRSPFP